jgi:hypothetical protein
LTMIGCKSLTFLIGSMSSVIHMNRVVVYADFPN